MTILGDKQRFAVEFIPLGDDRRPDRQCHFSYWVAGREVGNLAFEASVNDVHVELTGILGFRRAGDRENSELFALPAKEIIDQVHRGLMDEPDNTDKAWASHDIGYSMGHGYPLDAGRRLDVYVVEHGDKARLLVADEGQDACLIEVELRAGEVNEVLLSAWTLMEE